MISCIIIVCLCGVPILSALASHEPVPDKYPIKFKERADPETDKNDIMNEIYDCDNQVNLNWTFIRIQIYKGDYPKSKKFIAELNDSYKTQERLINSNIE